MTEHEWLTGTGLELGRFWGARFTERKARLITLACCRRHPKYLTSEAVNVAVRAVVDHYADPVAPDAPLNGPRITELYESVHRYAAARTDYPERGVAFGVVVTVEPMSTVTARKHSFYYLVYSCLTDVFNGLSRGRVDEHRGEQAAQGALVREILGNPFRALSASPTWRTDTVLALAQQMYVAEEFSAMPILADALQDAGCALDTVLDHCRDPRHTHVRGCWVLDLVLGKTESISRRRAPRQKRK
jgi:hypothetical protein